MNYGYLERGTLIKVGTILKMNGFLKEVVSFRRLSSRESYGRVTHNFSVEVAFLTIDSEVREYDKQDLEEMVANKTLKIYNES